VDPDAIIWNVSSQKWMPVGLNMTSKSEVTFKLLYSNWQNGQPMTKADLIYAMYFPVEWGTKTGPNDTTFDPEFTSQAQVALPLLKGIKFLDDNTIVSYVDLWHFDKKEIADFASVWASTPWEIMAATERLVVDGKFAYSKSEAMVKDIDWL
jgi:peptide/nickel transport system substrate-binding protein